MEFEGDDLGRLCNELIEKGVPQKEIIGISRGCDVSEFTVPGSRWYELMDVVGLFGCGISGGIAGAYIGYCKFDGHIGATILSGLTGSIVGMLYWGCDVNGDICESEREMANKLRVKYSHLLDI